MLGYSVSYFLSQYWRNVPLYAEKLIPLLDNCLSSGFVYSDKVAGAFYELTNKYQNTAALPLENLKEFIRENGYGYILDLMIQDEDSIKALWYLLVLIHQLKGSKEGLELVLSLFQEEYTPERQSLINTLGTPTRTPTGGFLSGKGPELLSQPLIVAGACPTGSNGWFNYELPAGSYISEAGTYTLSWTNLSFKSLGKFNSMTITATCANTDEIILYAEDNLLFTYPEKVMSTTFTMAEGDSPIKSIKFEYTCDAYGQEGACISGVNIKKGVTTYLPITDGIITSDNKFYEDYPVSKAFQDFNISATAPTQDGSITLLYPNSLDSGEYTLGWDMISHDTARYIKSLKVSIRYTDWDKKDASNNENTLTVFNETDLTYLYNNKSYLQTFRALKPFNQIYIEYSLSDGTTYETDAKAYISNLDIYKDSESITVKTIPNMTSNSTPKGSVVTNASFSEEHEAFKSFNYTNPSGAQPKSDGYVKYNYEEGSRPTIGDYTFTWANSSTDNNAYLTSLTATVTYIDNKTQVVANYTDLQSVVGKTRYYTKFTATNTIKSVTIDYTSTYSDGVGGIFSEANITKEKEDSVSGTGIDVWYESLPVSVENTFELTSSVDIGKTGSDFFYNFKNFVRHYVYPELLRLKVKYNLEGAQAQQIYSRSVIDYASTIAPTTDKLITVNTTPSDSNVTFIYGQRVTEGHSTYVIKGTDITFTVSKDYYYPQTDTVTVNDDMTVSKTLIEKPKYTITFSPVDSETGNVITGATFSLTSSEGTVTTSSVEVHEGTAVTYTISHENYKTVTGTVTATATETKTISMVRWTSVDDVNNMSLEEVNNLSLSEFEG